MVLLIALLGGCLALYPVSGLGVRMGLQHLLGNFEMAREEYLKRAGDRWYAARLEATDNLTLERVTGEFPVVGVWKNGLILRMGEALRAVGRNETAHNLYPLHIELIEGEPLRVVAHRIPMTGRTLDDLLAPLDPTRPHFLSGELRLGSRREGPLQDLERYQPAWLAGQTLILRHARAQDLDRYRHRVIAEGEVFLQLWLKPGDPPVALDLGEKPRREVIPRGLKGYL